MVTATMGPKLTSTSNWAVELDGLNILAAVITHPKMSYAEVKHVIINEGGTIDENGIVHKGSAINKVVEVI